MSNLPLFIFNRYRPSFSFREGRYSNFMIAPNFLYIHIRVLGREARIVFDNRSFDKKHRCFLEATKHWPASERIMLPLNAKVKILELGAGK